MRKLWFAFLMAMPLVVAAEVRAEEAGAPRFQADVHPVQLDMDALTERRIDGYRMLAITAGALGGAVATNMVIGGVVAPVVAGGAIGAIEGIGGAFMVAHGAAVVAGAVAGGYFADWLYRH